RLGTQKLGHTAGMPSVSADGKLLVTGGDACVRLWDAVTRKQVRELRLPPGHSGSAVVFAPDGKTIAAVGNAPGIALWETATGRELATLDRLPFFVSGVTFAPDSRTLAAVATTGDIHLLDIASGKEVRRIRPPLLDDGPSGQLARLLLRGL